MKRARETMAPHLSAGAPRDILAAMLALLLLLQAPSAEIVVTGQRLVEAQARCVRGGCTPLRDAQASIALAEARFRDGDYLAAKRMLAAAVARNRDRAATDPRPVAALYEACATVALHDGDEDAYHRAVADQVRTLRENLPPGDPAIGAAEVGLGEMWIKLGNFRQADVTLRSVERAAIAAGQDRAAMMAGMKRTWLAAALGEPTRAMRMLAELETRPLAADPAFRAGLHVLRLRISLRDADDREVATLAREIGRAQGATPALVWAPPYASDAAAAANAEMRKFGQSDAIPNRSSDVATVQWVDIGFWIRPDGRTAEGEVLRGSASHPWSAAALSQVERRLYTATAAGSGGGQGVYRIERVTSRARYDTPIDSNIRRRTAIGGFQVLDLTQDPAVPSR